MQNEARVGPKTVPEEDVRDSGEVRRNFRSPMEMLVNMQRDLAMLRDENRALRTPTPRRAALTSTEVPQFDGLLVGNNITKCLKQL